jgi:hypothetical protein
VRRVRAVVPESVDSKTIPLRWVVILALGGLAAYGAWRQTGGVYEAIVAAAMVVGLLNVVLS